ncbi:MAG: TonB-dependent siderophore receptor, partial [Nostoc sp.]
LSLKLDDATTLTLEYDHNTVNRTLYDGLLPIRESFNLPISRFLGEPNTSYYNYKSDAVSFTLEHRFSDNLRLRSAFLTDLYHADYDAVRPDSLEDDGRTISRTLA